MTLFTEGPSTHSHVLYNYVLMWDEPIHAVVATLPPVLGGSVIQQQWGSLLEGQLPRGPPHVVKLGDGLDLLHFWKESKGKRIHENSRRQPRSLSQRALAPWGSADSVPGEGSMSWGSGYWALGSDPLPVLWPQAGHLTSQNGKWGWNTTSLLSTAPFSHFKNNIRNFFFFCPLNISCFHFPMNPFPLCSHITLLVLLTL